MTIKEVEKLCNMERATLRFYEQQGLISPRRRENGYREYSQEDVQQLLRIKLLRALGVSLEEIGEIKGGARSLSQALKENVRRLESREQTLARAREVCRSIEETGISFADLDAPRYLAQLEEPEETLCKDRPDPVFSPARRYLARGLDTGLCSLPWELLFALVLKIDVFSWEGIYWYLFSCLSVLTLLFLEPLCLHLWGTTPGKAILGLHIQGEEGGYLSYGQALRRTWKVLFYGQGLNLPLVSLWCSWCSFRRARNLEKQPWEEENVLFLREDKERVRGIVFVACGLIMALINVTAQRQGMRVPNGLPLTVEDFAENYNALAQYLDMDYGRQLNAQGRWENIAMDYSPEGSRVPRPELAYTVKNGVLTGIAFSIWGEGIGVAATGREIMLLSSLAVEGAQKRADPLALWVRPVAKEIQKSATDSFLFEKGDVRFRCHVVTDGSNLPLGDANGVLLQRGESYQADFSIEIQQDARTRPRLVLWPLSALVLGCGLILAIVPAKVWTLWDLLHFCPAAYEARRGSSLRKVGLVLCIFGMLLFLWIGL